MITGIGTGNGVGLIRGGFPSTDTGSPGTTDLIAWWEMDETTGNRLDSHGSYDLTENPNSSYDTGVISNAYKCTSASNSGLNLAAISAFDDRSKDFSFTGWFYMPSTPTGFGAWLYTRRSGSGSTGNWYQCWWNTSNEVVFRIWDSGTASFTNVTVGAVSTGSWNFVAVCWNHSTKEVTASIDNGSPVTQTLPGYDITSGSIVAHNVMNAGFGSLSFNGARADIVNHWHRVLSDADKSWLYNSGAGRQYSDL